MTRPRQALLQPTVRFAICLFALALAPAAHAQGRAECLTLKSTILARSVRYCAFLPASFDTDKTKQFPVLYYLHG
ncbi:MAG TPA: hypothetical protein VF772_27630, partial [Terriglobales bacterium]